MLTTIYPTDIIQIVNSNHKSPHHILGIHSVEVTDRDGKKKKVMAIRAFIPDAKNITIAEKGGNETWAMDRIHSDGLFEAIIWNRNAKFDYTYTVEDNFGNSWSIQDPYADWVEGMTEFDRYLFNSATHYKLYEKLGAHLIERDGKKGVYFAVWAPNAQRVSVIGNFNGWDGRKHLMEFLPDSGIWVLFIPGLCEGDIYKYEIKTKDGSLLEKTDPFATKSELRPKTASIVHNFREYEWTDGKWLNFRASSELLFSKPLSIYEVHLGSWKRKEQDNGFLTYRDYADQLIPYVKDMGFNAIELMPIEEHPFDGSWGYQVTGYFAATSRFGAPEDLQYFINRCHEENISVILDWVPGHFPKDGHGLINFDGSALYEHADPRQGEHMDWGTKIFNYGRFEVKNFLISNALYWIDKFHFDGLRVDAVASMLYLDYSRNAGEWVSNKHGGRENLEAIEFFKHLNSILGQYYPGVMVIAEESTSFPGVTKPAYANGLGFSYKWNMGWMNDTLKYMQKDPLYKRYHHGELTFSFLYAWTENFILPISHDEVVHGKGSLVNKMPGDYWQKMANTRAFLSYMWGHPGKKLLFMGQEFAQFDEWHAEKSLDWNLLTFDAHRGIMNCVRDLNAMYQREKALWERDVIADGFLGINCDDSDNSIITFMRKSNNPYDFLIFVVNFTPQVKYNYTIGVPESCFYREIFNSDAEIYGGSNVGNMGGVHVNEYGSGSLPFSISLTVPPLAAIVLKPEYFGTEKAKEALNTEKPK